MLVVTGRYVSTVWTLIRVLAWLGEALYVELERLSGGPPFSGGEQRRPSVLVFGSVVVCDVVVECVDESVSGDYYVSLAFLFVLERCIRLGPVA